MRLFTPARHRALHCDAYLIDTSRRARPLQLDAALPLECVVEAVLERVQLMGRSLYAVRNRTFALFAGTDGGRFVVAPTEPYHEGVLAALCATLAEFGPVEAGEDRPLHQTALYPLLAYEKGAVAFFDGPPTRRWVPLAGRRGLRILAPAVAHAPDEEVFVGDLSATDYLSAPDEVKLDLAAMGDLPDDELDRLLDDQLKDWHK